MKQSDTPETEAAICSVRKGYGGSDNCARYIPIDFARRLERERDEALTANKQANAAIGDIANECKNISGERDQLRKVADELADRLSVEIGFDSCLVDSYYQLPHVKQKEPKI